MRRERSWRLRARRLRGVERVGLCRDGAIGFRAAGLDGIDGASRGTNPKKWSRPLSGHIILPQFDLNQCSDRSELQTMHSVNVDRNALSFRHPLKCVFAVLLLIKFILRVTLEFMSGLVRVDKYGFRISIVSGSSERRNKGAKIFSSIEADQCQFGIIALSRWTVFVSGKFEAISSSEEVNDKHIVAYPTPPMILLTRIVYCIG
jgi:hypothetical protein